MIGLMASSPLVRWASSPKIENTMSTAKPLTHQEYFAGLNSEQRAALKSVCRAIQAAAPGAEEGFSYGLPAFLWKGRPLAAFAASSGHCSYFPMSGSITSALAKDLKAYDTSKGTIRFTSSKPLPAALVKKLVKARLVELDGVKTGKTRQKTTKASPMRSHPKVNLIVEELRRLGNPRIRDEMGPRYGIHTNKAFGVPVGKLRELAKRLGRDHELAAALWKTGWYDARMLATLVDVPAQVTPTQMERWCKDFDNWGICDTACFHLFDKTPHAFAKVGQWARRKEEFVRRGAFALLASLALHDKKSDDGPFARCLPLVERASNDERNFVKKAVSWALRSMACRSPALHAESTSLAQRLAASDHSTERWIGKDVLRDITRPLVLKRVAKRSASKTSQ
jgi:3-methyladenine DNA glycosylase AlkD/uncharacterized protein YdhG (YjbR/CyaY superfamily)